MRVCHTRFGVHPMSRLEMTQARILSWLFQLVLYLSVAREIADQVEMLPSRGRDAERLFHQAVRLVTIPIWLLIVVLTVVTVPTTVRCPAGSRRKSPASATAFSFHLSICEETPGHSGRTPRLAISPPPHAGFSLVPDEHRTGLDLLPLLLGKPPTYPRQKTKTTCLEESYCIRWGADDTDVRLHSLSSIRLFK